MKKNRIIITLVLMLLSVACAWAIDPEYALGYENPATQTVNIVSSYATILGTMPAGTSKVDVIASGAMINYGPASVDSSTMWPYLTDGQIKTFPPEGKVFVGRNPKLYFCIRGTATASAKIGIAPH